MMATTDMPEKRDAREKWRRFDRAFTRTNQLAVALLLATMTVLVFANVIMRYLVGSSLTWVEELTRYMMIWLAYLGAGLAWRGSAHVAVDLLLGALSPGAAKTLRTAIVVGVMLFLATIAWFGVAYSSFAMGQKSAVLSLPMGLVYLAVPVGCVAMMIHILLDLRRYTIGAEPGETQSEVSA